MSSFLFWCRNPVFPTLFVDDTMLPPPFNLGIFVKDYLAMDMWANFEAAHCTSFDYVFYTSSMLFWLLELYNYCWNQEMRCPQFYSYPTALAIDFFHGSIRVSKLNFLFLLHWEVERILNIESRSTYHCGSHGNFNNINSFNPWRGSLFLFISQFFHQWVMILVYKSSHIFG